MTKEFNEPEPVVLNCTEKKFKCKCEEHKVWRLWYQRKQYILKNEDRIAKRHASNAKRINEVREYQRQYWIKNKEELSEYGKKWREEKKDHIREQRKGYRENNKEKIQESSKKYYEENSDKIKEYQKYHRENLRHPDWKIWDSVNQRCTNPNNPSYKYYGALGIVRHPSWNSFEQFIKDMGPRPEPRHLYSIDRKNPNGNYEPGNCRWATADIQTANQRRNFIGIGKKIPNETPIEKDNEMYTLKEFSAEFGIPLIVVKYRYAQRPEAEFILQDDYDNRRYMYLDQMFNITELSLLSGIHYSIIAHRLNDLNWSVKYSVETPENDLIEES